MNPSIQFKNSTILPVLIVLMLGCFGLSPAAQEALEKLCGAYNMLKQFHEDLPRDLAQDCSDTNLSRRFANRIAASLGLVSGRLFTAGSFSISAAGIRRVSYGINRFGA